MTKSQGLQWEDSQLGSADRLVKLTAVAIKAACIDIQLVQERDGKHQLLASTIFAEPEIETLEALVPTRHLLRQVSVWKARPNASETHTRLAASLAPVG